MFSPFRRRYKRLVFLPENYGAVGDGVTDDRIPIQTAINAAGNAGGGDVILFGNYVVSAAQSAGVSLSIYMNQYRTRYALLQNFSNVRIIIYGNINVLQNPPASSPVVAAFTVIAYGYATVSPLAIDLMPILYNTALIGIGTDHVHISLTGLTNAQLIAMNSSISGLVSVNKCYHFIIDGIYGSDGFGHTAILTPHCGARYGLIQNCNLTGRLNFTVAALTITNATNASPVVLTFSTAHGATNDTLVNISGVLGNTNANGKYYLKTTGFGSNSFALYHDFALTVPVVGNGNYISGGSAQLSPGLWTAIASAGIEGDGLRDSTIQNCTVGYVGNGIGLNANADNQIESTSVLIQYNNVIEFSGSALYGTAITGGDSNFSAKYLYNHSETQKGATIGLTIVSINRQFTVDELDLYPCDNFVAQYNDFHYTGQGTGKSGTAVFVNALATTPAVPNHDHVIDNNIFDRMTTAFLLNDAQCYGIEGQNNDLGGGAVSYTGTASSGANNIQTS